ncbi:hypothetical protein MTP99_005114 [Tenebrio molitor]|nr:hypothetical protein MTP99_005114 [Tenebrio molitor]
MKRTERSTRRQEAHNTCTVVPDVHQTKVPLFGCGKHETNWQFMKLVVLGRYSPPWTNGWYSQSESVSISKHYPSIAGTIHGRRPCRSQPRSEEVPTWEITITEAVPSDSEGTLEKRSRVHR